MALGLPRSVKSHRHLNRDPETSSHFSYVITSARCVTLGSTRTARSIFNYDAASQTGWGRENVSQGSTPLQETRSSTGVELLAAAGDSRGASWLRAGKVKGSVREGIETRR